MRELSRCCDGERRQEGSVVLKLQGGEGWRNREGGGNLEAGQGSAMTTAC